MKRRNFLTMLGAAGLTPALSSVAAPAPVVAGYNRYMYGLAVFHARTRASVSATDLVARLKVSTAQAEAMIGEMTAKGVIAPLLNATSGAMRALDPHYQTFRSHGLERAARKVSELLKDNGPAQEHMPATGQNLQDDAGDKQEPDNGQV